MSDQPESTWFPNPTDLTHVEQDCWRCLSGAVTDRDSGWRLPVLATSESGQSRQRILVLRSVDTVRKHLFFHTDVRSAKVVTLRANPVVSWLFYDHDHQVQLQVTGQAEVQTGLEETEWLWNSQPPASLKGYLATMPPGRRCAEPESNIPLKWQGKVPESSDLAAGRPNFAVIRTTVAAMEWVSLRRTGNLRAFFEYRDVECITREWRAP